MYANRVWDGTLRRLPIQSKKLAERVPAVDLVVLVNAWIFLFALAQNSMDYKGQRLSEYIYSIITILFGAIAWIVGYVKGDFQITVYGWAGGLVLALLVCYSGVPLCTIRKLY
jgi:hypothetical protein